MGRRRNKVKGQLRETKKDQEFKENRNTTASISLVFAMWQCIRQLIFINSSSVSESESTSERL